MDGWKLNKKPWFQQVLLERKANDINEFKQPYFVKPTPEIDFTDTDQFSLSKVALQVLEPKEKAAFILRFKQNYSQQKVSEALGLSLEQIQNLFSSLLSKLQQNPFGEIK